MNDQEAFLSIAIATLACDGRMRNDEAAALRRLLENRELFSSLGAAGMSELSSRVAKRFEEEDPKLIIDQALACLDPKHHDTIIAVSAHLVFADRIVDDQERGLLNYLCTHGSFSGSLDPVATSNAFAAFYAGTLRAV
ncbi:tellurite resistance TerB family protein [Synechococcus sp. NB0720_010]|jgi:tellurite resistance protein|uniref:tellurite resistance TerB family protein n=1 Tax=Synechococcus sp. NB0720_010 TaxID=2907159 RepID=UPI001FFB7CED|nr:tellurite resistance TerB family protein [Synechococcus sp. NB0720_010]UPH91028.1 tellurite resistance TerB family protein [Synechococcus sp. NB0720_010]